MAGNRTHVVAPTKTHSPQSLRSRERRIAAGAVTCALVLSLGLAGVAIGDQLGPQTLADHASTLYAPDGERPEPRLLYGLVYTVAGSGALLWLAMRRVVRSRSRVVASVLVGGVTAATAALALLLLVATEYGDRVFPAMWGLLATLPTAAGVVAVLLLLRPPEQGGAGKADHGG